MQVETFADVLVRASNAEGSLLGLANRLGVAPVLVYRWIARIDQPTEEQRLELQARLRFQRGR